MATALALIACWLLASIPVGLLVGYLIRHNGLDTCTNSADLL